ncbi:hypothetical protein Misp01_56630 [Microtetraspora sp. NBRC 13810]|nr:hypothetical protein Misp01_56630 [Microtetraspora sp. NBRC 13810]
MRARDPPGTSDRIPLTGPPEGDGLWTGAPLSARQGVAGRERGSPLAGRRWTDGPGGPRAGRGARFGGSGGDLGAPDRRPEGVSGRGTGGRSCLRDAALGEGVRDRDALRR